VTGSALRVGLTGGIASGKTTVAAAFRRLGAVVVDADAVAHDILEPGGSAYEAVVSRFGAEILDAKGRIVRSALAAIVFSDERARADLDALVHPKILEESERRMARELARRPAPIAVLEAALLVETGLYRRFHRIVLTSCSKETQLRRLIARGLSAGQAFARIEAQEPLPAKTAVADFIVDTEGTLEQTRLRTEQVYAALLAEHAERASG
jgi:dephospho-CoA kinase